MWSYKLFWSSTPQRRFSEKVAKVYSYREKLMLIPNMKHFCFQISFFNGTQDNYGLKRPALTPNTNKYFLCL